MNRTIYFVDATLLITTIEKLNFTALKTKLKYLREKH